MQLPVEAKQQRNCIRDKSRTSVVMNKTCFVRINPTWNLINCVIKMKIVKIYSYHYIYSNITKI